MILKKELLLANYWGWGGGGGGSSPQLLRLLRPWIEFKSDKTGTIGLKFNSQFATAHEQRDYK